jgi:uncharacterized tellurite resistance protein B-like protein
MSDRIDVICDLLLGAAFADDHFHEKEKQAINELLGKLVEGAIPEGVTKRIEYFDAGDFDAKEAAGAFKDDSDDDKYKVLELIAAVHDADDEYDFAEDDYMREVASAMGMKGDALSKFTIDIEFEELKSDLGKLRTPPPPPGS